MSTAALERVETRSERERILLTLGERTEEVVDTAVAALRAEIPAYAEADETFLGDVRHQLRLHHRTKLTCLLAGAEPTGEDLAFARRAAMRRARSGLGLEDYISAFRVSQQVFWDAILDTAGRRPAAREAALTLTTPLLRYCDVAQTHVGHAFAEQQAVVNADRGELLEHLLAGEIPSRAAAHFYGLGADTTVLVVVAIAADPDCDPNLASAAFSRSVLGSARTLVVVRRGEIVAVPALGPGCSTDKLCDRVLGVYERLRDEGLPLAVGVSTAADGVGEIPRAYVEARAALECVGASGGVAALPRMTAFRYLTLRAPETARRLVDPVLREVLADDRVRDTVRALAAADLRINVAAELLQVHVNTAKYRLRRIEELTGRNPRHVGDLIELLTAIELEEELA